MLSTDADAASSHAPSFQIFKLNRTLETAKTIRALAISHSGDFFISASDDCSLIVWDLQMGNKQRLMLEGHTDCVLCIAITQDDETVASGSVDGTVRLWCIKTGVCCTVIVGMFWAPDNVNCSQPGW